MVRSERVNLHLGPNRGQVGTVSVQVQLQYKIRVNQPGNLRLHQREKREEGDKRICGVILQGALAVLGVIDRLVLKPRMQTSQPVTESKREER